jgi:chemotaxis protein CheX
MQYSATERDGVQIIQCPATIEPLESSAMDALLKNWLSSSAMVHVLDFEKVKDFKSTAYRSFVLFNQNLKAMGKSLYVMNVNPELTRQFAQDGLNSIFQIVDSPAEAREKAAPKGADIDYEFVNPFIAAARSVLETQAQIKINPGKPVIKKADDKHVVEIAGVVAISCKEFTGSINLCFKTDVFLKIYEGLTGEKHTKVTFEIEDAAAEMLNIIFGQAKTVLNDQKGYMLDRALPTVLSGDSMKLYHSSKAPVVLIPFESQIGPFHIEMVMEKV